MARHRSSAGDDAEERAPRGPSRRPRSSSSKSATSRPRLGQLLVWALGWGVVGALLMLLFSQTFDGGAAIALLVVGQTLMPYAAPLALAIGIAALVSRRRWLALASGIAVLGTLVLAAPLVWHPDPPQVDADAPTLTVTYANVYWQSTSTVLAADALLDTKADVLVMSELTPAAVEALDAIGATEAYPYRVGEPSTSSGPTSTEGIAIWSRFPLEDASLAPIGPTAGVEATVVIDGRRLRVVTSHPDPAFTPGGRDTWVPSLRALNERARDSNRPTLVVADVNASWWHPSYRRILCDGLVDVHQVLGEGFSTSWPANRRFVPAFTRIDHALVHGAVQPIGIDDVTVPGSDHEGFTVRVAVGVAVGVAARRQ